LKNSEGKRMTRYACDEEGKKKRDFLTRSKKQKLFCSLRVENALPAEGKTRIWGEKIKRGRLDISKTHKRGGKDPAVKNLSPRFASRDRPHIVEKGRGNGIRNQIRANLWGRST